MADYSRLTTESINEKTKNIDKMSAIEIAKVINDEDKTVAFAVEKALPQIAAGIDMLADSLKCGGHIYYCGAGTSGRLGVLERQHGPEPCAQRHGHWSRAGTRCTAHFL